MRSRHERNQSSPEGQGTLAGERGGFETGLVGGVLGGGNQVAGAKQAYKVGYNKRNTPQPA